MHAPARLPSRRRPSWLRLAAGASLAAVLALGAAPARAQTPSSATPKIAVIDLRRAVIETEEGLRVQSKLRKLAETRQGDIEAKFRQLQADKEAFEKDAQKPNANKAELQKKAEKLQAMGDEFQKLQMEAQRDMQRKQDELTGPILAGIIEAVKRIAAQDGFEMVLEKNAVPYFRADLELTDRAIQMYNGGQAGGGKGAPAGKPGATPPAPPPGPAKPAPSAPPAPAPGPKK
jgi:outer membrane protein